MRIVVVALLLVHSLVVSQLASGAAVGRHESEGQHTSVITLLNPAADRSTEVEESRNSERTEEYGIKENYDEEYYYDEDYEDEEESLSGDYDVEMPRVAMSSKPNDPSAILNAEEGRRKSRKGRKKGKGKKRNPCLKKYKDFCIHGTCRYLRDLRAPSCVCHPNFSGDRCQLITLGVYTPESYSRTTALAVVAVVLSTVCLTIIGLLLMLRFHKRGAYDVENEEKVKLGLASNH